MLVFATGWVFLLLFFLQFIPFLFYYLWLLYVRIINFIPFAQEEYYHHQSSAEPEYIVCFFFMGMYVFWLVIILIYRDFRYVSNIFKYQKCDWYLRS